MTNKKLQGTGTALITPFKNNGAVDEQALRELVEWQIKNKVEFLVPCGSTGESATMTRGERRRVIEIVFEQADGRVGGGFDGACSAPSDLSDSSSSSSASRRSS